MNVIAFNGSPRKKGNTATLLENALAGAKNGSAKTALVHLYDLTFKGCISCFACKKIGGKHHGRCAQKDELSPILDRAAEADLLILGSPIYFFTETAMMRSFMERLIYPYLSYTPGYASLFPRKIHTGLVYTMNLTAEQMPVYGQDKSVAASRWWLAHIFGHCEVLNCFDTQQFNDYSKYLSTAFDADAKVKRRQEIFPKDCLRAYEFGRNLIAINPTIEDEHGADRP